MVKFLKEKRLFFVLVCMAALLVISIFIIQKLRRQIIILENAKTVLPFAQKIEYFDLIGTNNDQVNALELSKSPINIIFIFKQPCAPCNQNLTMWRRISKIVENKNVNVYGIWLGRQRDMFEFQETTRDLEFTVYSPLDLYKFKRSLVLKYNYAQTILYIDNKVEKVILGNLDGNDYTSILRRINRRLKNKE